MVLRPVACGGSRRSKKRDALRRPLHRSRYFRRICAATGGEARSFQGFRPGGRGLLAAIAGARWFSPGGGGRESRQRATEGRAALLERFRAKWIAVRVKKTRQNKIRASVLVQTAPIKLQ